MMKKIFKSIFVLLLFLSLLISVGFFLPNEISFKYLNLQENFLEARNISNKFFPQLNLLVENNEFGNLYKQKKYSELESKIKEISEKKCNLKNEKISEFCANIFYLKGLNFYQLGKDLKSKKQKDFFEKAILEFTKVMIMTEKNSQEYIWAKENIDFLQQKFQENQTQEPKKNSEKNNQKSDSQKKSEKNSDSENKQENNSPNNSEEKKSKKDSESSNNTPQDSRLPQEMQQALEQVQKKLEEDQKNSQKGFNRSKSAAEKNNLDNSDPFDVFNQDPFFQNFFGNDPFFQNPFKKKFNKKIQNSDEKDW